MKFTRLRVVGLRLEPLHLTPENGGFSVRPILLPRLEDLLALREF